MMEGLGLLRQYLGCISPTPRLPGYRAPVAEEATSRPPLPPRVAAQAEVSASPSSIEREALDPPISVWTQPGQTELTRMPLPRSSEVRIRVRTFRPALENHVALPDDHLAREPLRRCPALVLVPSNLGSPLYLSASWRTISNPITPAH